MYSELIKDKSSVVFKLAKSKGSVRARAASGARAVNAYQQGFNVAERPRGRRQNKMRS